MLLRQVVHHVIERVDLQDVGGLEVLQAQPPRADAPHQLLDGHGQVPHHEIDAEHTEGQSDQDRDDHPYVELPAHAEQILLHVQPQQHPFRIFIGDVVAVQSQGARHGIDALSVQGDALHLREILIPRLLQGEAAVHGPDQIVKDPLAHQRDVAALAPLHGQHVSRLLGVVELRHREIIVQGPAGDLHAQHGIGLPLIPQGDGI